MTDPGQGTVNVQLNTSNSVPNTPTTKKESSKLFLKKTPIPKVIKWVKGTPLQEESMSPNQQAFSLLKGFA